MKMMKFFFFSSLAHLYLIMSSSVMPQYGDTEQKQYDDFELLRAFRKYLTVPTRVTYDSFRSYVRGYYDRSPIECLNLLDRFRSNRVFNVLIWQALAEPYDLIDPTKIAPVYYSKVLEWISRKIRFTLFYCSCSDESKFKTELETISLLVKTAERTVLELKFLGNNNKLLSEFDDLVAIWTYLIRNISYDFNNKSIDYYSLFRTLNEVGILIKTDSSSTGPSLRLTKRYALLWFYLRHIYNSNCNVIFEIYHHHKAFIIYLVTEFDIWLHSNGNELYPVNLIFLIEKLYENESQQLNTFSELLRRHAFFYFYDPKFLGIPWKIPNYIELVRSPSKGFKKYSLRIIWRIKALAELEAYLIQHGWNVDYSIK